VTKTFPFTPGSIFLETMISLVACLAAGHKTKIYQDDLRKLDAEMPKLLRRVVGPQLKTMLRRSRLKVCSGIVLNTYS
jgi:hypothetical protein